MYLWPLLARLWACSLIPLAPFKGHKKGFFLSMKSTLKYRTMLTVMDCLEFMQFLCIINCLLFLSVWYGKYGFMICLEDLMMCFVQTFLFCNFCHNLLKILVTSTKNNDWSTIINHRESPCDCRKALLNGHHDRHYLDIATNFINFNSSANSSKTIFVII